jgi:hypothetical protein
VLQTHTDGRWPLEKELSEFEEEPAACCLQNTLEERVAPDRFTPEPCGIVYHQMVSYNQQLAMQVKIICDIRTVGYRISDIAYSI